MSINNSLAKHILSSDDIREKVMAFQESRLILTAYELGLFTALGEGSKTANEVAKVIKTSERSVERLMNVLCGMGLLNKKEGEFLNTPLSLRFLVEDNPEFMAGLMHSVNMWDSWSTLTEAVRKGRSVLDLDERDDNWLKSFIAAMHERAVKQAPSVIRMLDLSGVRRLLDVGGGSGEYSMAFVKANNDIKVTVFDLPNVVFLTKKYLKEQGLLDKIEIATGDYNIDDLGNGFDMVFLSAIIHINSFEENMKLIRKCASALNFNGQLVVQDFIMDENRVNPAFGALFSLNMLVATEAGDTYTEFEVRNWMEQAGLSKISRKDTNFNTALIIGRKIK